MMRAGAAFLFICALLAAPGLPAAAPGAEPDLAIHPDALVATLQEAVREGVYPFLSLHVEDRDGRVLFSHTARNPELVPQPMDADSYLRIWSMSKLVTISLAMDLVEAGVLSLADPVTKFLPELGQLRVAVSSTGRPLTGMSAQFYAGGAADGLHEEDCATVPVTGVMTIGDLIHHKAGFYYPVTGIPCLDEPAARLDLPLANNTGEFLEKLKSLPLIEQPGRTYHYGLGTTVLGFVLERATGRSLKALVEQRLTGPAGIDGLRCGLPEGVQLPPRVSGASGALAVVGGSELDIFGGAQPRYEPAHELCMGGAGMLGTLDGYADFARLLLDYGRLDGYRLLDPATVRLMTAPHTQLDSDYGYNGFNLWVANGLRADGSQGRGGLWTGGGYEGTRFWIDTAFGLVGVMGTQVFSPPAHARDYHERLREEVYRSLIFRAPSGESGGLAPGAPPAASL